MQCRSNSGTVQLLPDQTSRSREARSLVASVLPVMSRCAIAEDGENRRLKSVEYFFLFLLFKFLLICWGRNDDNCIDASKKKYFGFERKLKRERYTWSHEEN